MYFLIFLLLCCVVVAGSFLVFHQKYLRSPYFQCTKLPYREMREDSGRYGEYLVYKYLSEFERFGAKFLFNAYIPKQNGETSEIDVLMLCTKGIFVIESKNYSGWIFGNENQNHGGISIDPEIKNCGYGQEKRVAIYSLLLYNSRLSVNALPNVTSSTYSISVPSEIP